MQSTRPTRSSPPNRRSRRLPLSSLASAVVIAVGFQGGVKVSAGEAIDFSGGKSKVDVSLENRLSKEKAAAANRRAALEAPQQLEGVAQPQVTSPNRKEEKRRKDEQLEKKSWILVDRGELQQSDKADGEFGVRDEAMESEKTAADIWFSRKDGRSPKAPHQPQQPSAGPRAPSSERAILPPRADVDEKPEPKAKEAEGGQVTHSVRELDVRTTLIDPSAKEMGPRIGTTFDPANGDRGRRMDNGFRLGNSEVGRSSSLQGPGLGRESRDPLARPNSPGGFSGGPTLNGFGTRAADAASGSGFNSAPIGPSYNNPNAQNNLIQQPRNAFGVESSRSGR